MDPTKDRTESGTAPPLARDRDAPPPSVVVVLVILFAMLMAVAMAAVVWRVPPPKD